MVDIMSEPPKKDIYHYLGAGYRVLEEDEDCTNAIRVKSSSNTTAS